MARGAGCPLPKKRCVPATPTMNDLKKPFHFTGTPANKTSRSNRVCTKTFGENGFSDGGKAKWEDSKRKNLQRENMPYACTPQRREGEERVDTELMKLSRMSKMGFKRKQNSEKKCLSRVFYPPQSPHQMRSFRITHTHMRCGITRPVVEGWGSCSVLCARVLWGTASPDVYSRGAISSQEHTSL